MQGRTIIWTLIFVIAGSWLVYRATSGIGMGKAYVERTEQQYVNVSPAGETDKWIEVNAADAKEYDFQDLSRYPLDERVGWTKEDHAKPTDWAEAERANPGQQVFVLSPSQTIGLWLAAFFTLGIFSFLYRDNPFYKISEAVVVGVSAAYWMVVAFHTTLLPNLFGKIWPNWIQSWAMPGLEAERNLWYLVPLVLGVFLLMRLSPKGGWISRWPLAFFIGVFCGLRLMGYMHADFLNQIRNAIVPLVVFDDDGFNFWDSLSNFFLVAGLLVCLVYFFFSFEHKGIVGKTAKVGIWVLMITFGAGFGYTVMGRIALLAIRLEFLFDDWLWLIDPTGQRVGL
ncbi:MAG: hypothetical protein V3S08_01720 [Phycisphaerales bacterium]